MIQRTQNRWLIFGIAAGLFMLSLLYRGAIAVIAPDLVRDLTLTPKDLGMLGAFFFYPFALAQFPLGFFLDRFGARRAMISLNLIGILGVTIFALAPNATLAMLGRAMLGLGMSANLVGSLKLYTAWFKPTKFATVGGLHIGTGAVGSLLATSPMVLLAQALTWRGAFLLLAAVNLLLVLGLTVFVNNTPVGWCAPAQPAAIGFRSLWGDLKQLFKSFNYWCVALTGGFRFGVYSSIQTLWVGPFLMVGLGLSPLAAGNLIFIMVFGNILGSPASGLLSDRLLHSRKKAVTLSNAVVSLTTLALAFWPTSGPLPLLAGLLFLFGFSMPYNQILLTQVKESMPTHMSGLAMTGTNFFIMFTPAVLMQVMGLIIGSQAGKPAGGSNFFTAFLICFAALALASAVYLGSRDTKPDDSPQIPSDQDKRESKAAN